MRGQISLDPGGIEAVGVLIRDERHFAPASIACQQPRRCRANPAQQARFNHHIIGAARQRHGNYSHWSIASIIARAVSAWGPFSLMMRMGASP